MFRRAALRPGVAEIVAACSRWLSDDDLPALFFNAELDTILAGAHREFCRAPPDQQEDTVRGYRFIQEDLTAEIGEAVAGCLSALR